MNQRHIDKIIWAMLAACSIVLLALILLTLPAHAEEGQTLYAVVEEGSVLNVRDAPGNGDVYLRLERGEAVTLLENKNGWAYVAVGSEYGWACMDYLSAEPPTDGPVQARIAGNGRVALRDKPDGERVKWMQPDDTVTVYGYLDGTDARWARVDGGYVMAEYVEKE